MIYAITNSIYLSITYLSVVPMQSLNGVYVNGARIEPSTPVPLQEADEICFGTNIPKNELMYSLTRMKDGSHSLRRVGAKPLDDSSNKALDKALDLDRDATPPLEEPAVKRPRLESVSAPAASSHSSGTTAPNTDTSSASTSARPSPSSVLVSPAAPQLKSVSAPTASPHSSDITAPTAPTAPNTNTNSALTSARPSPSTVLVSPTAVIDELFPDNVMEKCFEDVLSDAIFGEAAVPFTSSTDAPVRGQEHMDATSIRILVAKDEMQKEKEKLLSSIEALKSELASKEQLLAEKANKERQVEDSRKSSDGVIDSMQEEFTCVICQELFVMAHTLSCSHSFCERCIKEWMKSKKRRDCPICRKTITAEPVHSLVLDNAIEKMVEKMDAKVKEERRKLKESYVFKPAASGAGTRGRTDVARVLAAASALGVLTRSRASADSVASGSSAVSSGRGGGASVSGGASGRGGAIGRGGGAGGSSGRGGVAAGARGRGAATLRRGGGRGGVPGAGSTDSPIVITDTPPRSDHSRHSHLHSTTVSRDGNTVINVYYTVDDTEEEEEDDEEDEETDEDGDSYYSEEDYDDYDQGLPDHYYGGYGRCYNCGELNLLSSQSLFFTELYFLVNF